jgi:serine/threonine-protein kinase
LNLISSPPSTVVLDGKPLGLTPKTGISVSPGPHTLLFVHPEHGRKSRTITVSPGKTATATVSFP